MSIKIGLLNYAVTGMSVDFTAFYDTPIAITVSPDHNTVVFYTTHDGKTMDWLEVDGTAFVLEDPDNHLELDIAAHTEVIQGKLTRTF